MMIRLCLYGLSSLAISNLCTAALVANKAVLPPSVISNTTVLANMPVPDELHAKIKEFKESLPNTAIKTSTPLAGYIVTQLVTPRSFAQGTIKMLVARLKECKAPDGRVAYCLVPETGKQIMVYPSGWDFYRKCPQGEVVEG